VRLSWYLLFLLTASCGLADYQRTGAVSLPLVFIATAHFLYTNACAKVRHYARESCGHGRRGLVGGEM
jgi:hypothetical protein